MRSLRRRCRAQLWVAMVLPFIVAGEALGVGDVQVPADPVATGYVETSGLLEPIRRYVQRLEPGQKVVSLPLVADRAVKEGDGLAVLSDDALTSQMLSLEERRLNHLRDVQERDLLRLEIVETASEVNRIKAEFGEEKRLEKQLPNYSDGVRLRELQTSLQTQEAALRVKRGKLELMNRQIAEAAPVLESIEAQLRSVKLRLAALNVRAPFPGRLVEVMPYPQNAAPGDVVFELWDEQAYRVVVDLWQNQVGYVRPGDTAEVISDFDAAVKLHGTVRSILPARTNQEDGRYPRFPTVVELDAGQSVPLVVGMSVAVRIHITPRR